MDKIDSMFYGNLADMQNIVKYNGSITFLLIVSDVFSRLLLVVSLENKLRKTIIDALVYI